MITERILSNLKSWFSNYVRGFYSNNMELNENIKIKAEHTKRVCIEILAIAQSLNLDRKAFYLAETAALLHDIGRFEQYKRYGTFMDGESENHAMLGVNLLSQIGILADIDPPTAELILRLIRCHNLLKLPDGGNDAFLLFLKLLRDADKIDIWRVVTDYYGNPARKRSNGIELGLPDIPYVSERIIEDITGGNIAKLGNMKTLNDFKLLQMSWIFDINFPKTFQIIKERKYLDKIHNALPQSANTLKAYLAVNSHLELNLKNTG